MVVKSSSTSQVELPKEVNLPKVADLPHVVDQQIVDQPKVDQPIVADIPKVEEQQMVAQQLKQEEELAAPPEPSSCPTAPTRRKAEGAADGSRVATLRRNSSPCLGGRKAVAQGPSIRQGNHVDQSSNRNRSKWSLSSLLKTFAIR
ncbi:hypothetical protein J437_LFUL010183 [Ladona fulva]|uniref:Uncharacterized protein n=1 Tax=Ladona fulva TaxID=123851 RepID=A0A8K0K8N8_LADFU|nr:hypothetical protein J437_LFUL010183 [Ladona fulva]